MKFKSPRVVVQHVEIFLLNSCVSMLRILTANIPGYAGQTCTKAVVMHVFPPS
jgi:hypothetical protein